MQMELDYNVEISLCSKKSTAVDSVSESSGNQRITEIANCSYF
jgi:hypothetical protein